MQTLLKYEVFNREIKVRRIRKFRYYDDRDRIFSIPQHKPNQFVRVIDPLTNYNNSAKYLHKFIQNMKGFKFIDPFYYNSHDLANCSSSLRSFR